MDHYLVLARGPDSVELAKRALALEGIEYTTRPGEEDYETAFFVNKEDSTRAGNAIQNEHDKFMWG